MSSSFSKSPVIVPSSSNGVEQLSPLNGITFRGSGYCVARVCAGRKNQPLSAVDRMRTSAAGELRRSRARPYRQTLRGLICVCVQYALPAERMNASRSESTTPGTNAN
eukprot:1172309-Prorocentrum_minimum.AAC.2